MRKYELKEKEQPDLVKPKDDADPKKMKRGTARLPGVSHDEITTEKITDFEGKEIFFIKPNCDKLKNPFFVKFPITVNNDVEGNSKM